MLKTEEKNSTKKGKEEGQEKNLKNFLYLNLIQKLENI